MSRTKGDVCTYELEPKDSSAPREVLCRELRPTISSCASPEEEDLAKSLACFPVSAPSSERDFYQVNPSLSFPSTSPEPFKDSIIKNPQVPLQDYDDPFAFALSGISLDDLNLNLYALCFFRLVYPSEKLAQPNSIPLYAIRIRCILPAT